MVSLIIFILAKTEIKPEPKPEPNRVPVHQTTQPPSTVPNPIQNSTARPKLSRPGQPQFQLPNQPKAPSPINISNPSMRTNQKPGSRGKQPIQFAPRVSSPNPSQRITVTQSQPGNKGPGIFIKNRLPGPGPIRPGVRPFRNQIRANGPHNMQNGPGPHHGPHGHTNDGPNGQPRMQNGEGRTVIGTKTVDGRQQEITMNNSVLRQNTRVSQVTNSNVPVKGNIFYYNYTSSYPIILVPNPPANLKLTPKLVGGKTVQLVTPNVGPSRRPRLPPGGSGPGGPRGPVPRPQSGTFRHPIGVQINRQPPTQQNHRPAVNVRTAVGGAEIKPPTQNVTKGQNLIKLTGSKVNDSKQQNSADPNGPPSVQNTNQPEESVSNRQLAEIFLKTGSSRKISKAKGSEEVKPVVNKATERLHSEMSKVPITPINHKIEKPNVKKEKSKGLFFFSFIGRWHRRVHYSSGYILDCNT